MEVQIFGTRKHPVTRSAIRFFAERRIRTHFVDLSQRAASPGELRRFAQKFGVEALIDRAGRRFSERGLGPARYGAERWLDLLADDPMLLRQPLVRNGNLLTIGEAQSVWKEWMG